jgi:hypothetical protein
VLFELTNQSSVHRQYIEKYRELLICIRFQVRRSRCDDIAYTVSRFLIETLDLNHERGLDGAYVRRVHVLGDVRVTLHRVRRVAFLLRSDNIVSFDSRIEAIVIGAGYSCDDLRVLDQLERWSVVSQQQRRAYTEVTSYRAAMVCNLSISTLTNVASGY